MTASRKIERKTFFFNFTYRFSDARRSSPPLAIGKVIVELEPLTFSFRKLQSIIEIIKF